MTFTATVRRLFALNNSKVLFDVRCRLIIPEKVTRCFAAEMRINVVVSEERDYIDSFSFNHETEVKKFATN